MAGGKEAAPAHLRDALGPLPFSVQSRLLVKVLAVAPITLALRMLEP